MPAAARGFALSGSNLILFDPADLTQSTSVAISGLNPGETLVGLDVRPMNGFLYALGVNEGANTGTLYVISPRTGVATAIGTPGQIAFVDSLGDPVDLPAGGYGFDVNPASDRIRVTTTTGINFRINPNTGAPMDGNFNGGAVAGINPDGTINGATTTVSEAAHIGNQFNAAVTSLYTIDEGSDSLYIQSLPNSGTQISQVQVTLNGNPLNFTAVAGFDIATGVNTIASNTPATSGEGYAVLTVDTVQALYRINLVTGAATRVGAILAGGPITSMAIQSDEGGLPAIALTADGLNLTRFSTATPGTTVTVAVTGMALFEQLVGIDWRPQTGQLYGFGVNGDLNNGTLYLIDPLTGAATVVGPGGAGSIAFVNGLGAAIDLPASGYGFDFNPTVDRIRVTTNTGLNFRINPNNGSPVDGDFNLGAGSVTGINPDALINGLPSGSTGIAATAYTNSFGQPLTGGTTTMYVLDPNSNRLMIQQPANSGAVSVGVAVTVNGAPIDFTAVAGFDIPSDPSVTTSGATAGGYGYASLTVGGVAGLYRIDLASGAAVNLGTIGAGGGLSGLALGEQPSNLFTEASDTTTLPYAGAAWYARGGNDVVTGTGSGDIVHGETGNDTISGLAGADILHGGDGADSLVGGDDNDVLIGGPGADVLNGGPGLLDRASYRTSSAAVAVYPGLPASSLGDAAGDIHVDVESYELTNAAAPDTFFGAAAGEEVFGLAGNDILFGNGGNDTLYGGVGNDFLLPGTGADVLVGGDGFDAVSYGDSASGLTIDLASPPANTGFAAGDQFFQVEAFLLTEQGDVMRGLDNPAAGDILYGLGGADRLEGRGGFDYLLGGDGADTLVGGFGYDLMIGGAGADVFVYNTGGEGGAFAGGGELITDFQVGVDKIAFVAASTGIASLTLGANLFIQNSGFTPINGQQGTTTGPTLIYDTLTGGLWYDTNGSSIGGLLYLVGLTGAPALTAADFMVI